jgi:hypothetical protein
MRRQRFFRTTAFCSFLLFALALCASSLPPPSAAGAARPDAVFTPALDWQAKVDAGVLRNSALGRAEFLVYMSEKADLSGAVALATKEEKGGYVYDRLTATAP